MTVKQRVPMEEYSTTLTPPMVDPLTEAPNPNLVRTDDENNPTEHSELNREKKCNLVGQCTVCLRD